MGDLGSIPGLRDPLEKKTATHASVLVWKIPWTEKPGRHSPWSCKKSDTIEQLTSFLLDDLEKHLPKISSEIQHEQWKKCYIAYIHYHMEKVLNGYYKNRQF